MLGSRLPRSVLAELGENRFGREAGAGADRLGTIAIGGRADVATEDAAEGFSHAVMHLAYARLEPHPLEFHEIPGMPCSYRVEKKMKLSKDRTTVTVNPSLKLSGISPEVFEYRLGNRSAVEWVIDQYHVKEDKRSGIVSDPNREGHPEYIVRLLGQVVYVSLRTVELVNSLPAVIHVARTARRVCSKLLRS